MKLVKPIEVAVAVAVMAAGLTYGFRQIARRIHPGEEWADVTES